MGGYVWRLVKVRGCASKLYIWFVHLCALNSTINVQCFSPCMWEVFDLNLIIILAYSFLWIVPSDYNGDLNTGLVWYSKVIWMQEWIWSNFQITIWTGIQMGVCILEHHFYIKFVVECKMCVCTFAHPHEHGTNLPSSNQLSHRSDLHIPNASYSIQWGTN